MPNNAVGLEQVGGVTQAAKGMVQNADTRLQSGKTLRSTSEGTAGRMVGPGGDLTRGALDSHAEASGRAGVAGADVGVSFARGEKAVEQGTVDVIGVQKTPNSEGQDLASSLSRPLSA